jgi:hypothetical protein
MVENKSNQQPKTTEQKVVAGVMSPRLQLIDQQPKNPQEKLALEGGREGLGSTTDALYH